jgi:cellulose synthase/poly-beta-1,6-N-acetylglucosamine synthase-like glycosyltransferase
MTDIEIPYEKDRHGHYRFFEILPGTLSYTLLLLPFILSIIDVRIAAIFVLLFILIYVTRGISAATRGMQAFRVLKQYQKYDWRKLLAELDNGDPEAATKRPAWHAKTLRRVAANPVPLKPADLIHAIIIATYNESREVLEPTIKSVLASHYDMKQVMLILAYEERGGEQVEAQSKALIAEYKDQFMDAMAIKHPKDIPGEVIGKGGNVTYAGRQLQTYLSKRDIDPMRVIVTTLDSDNRPDKQYLPALSYIYAAYHDPVRISVQPVTIYSNNIWDAPAPMRVIATGNSFYNIVLSLRPHILRNFSAHAQNMKALIDMDFWSVRTIVEDGHQFWRSYFRYDGNYRVLPLYIPIYQDAVLTDGYRKTLKAQFIQLRRWTYGASDVAFVVDKGFFKKNRVPRLDLIGKTWRLLEGHVSWAAAPLLLLFAGYIPALFHPQSYPANELPLILSRIQRFAMLGVVVLIFIAIKTLPPKPLRYKRHRSFWMVLQWVYLPVTTIGYNCTAAFYSQTRLMFRKYISKFDVTEKAVVDEHGRAVS